MSTNSIIWMGDIEPKITEQDIINYFLFFNIRPQSVKLIKDKATNENKNYCFIYFKTIKEANSVLFKLNGKNIPGTKNVFRLNWANIRSPFSKSAYVGNLNPKVDDLKLFNLFKKKYPSVHHASVITENGIPKGYGFVLFNNEEEYKMSLKEMDRINFYGNLIKVRQQKKKKDKSKKSLTIVDNEDDSSTSSFLNDSEKNYDLQNEKKINNIIKINNINNIYNINYLINNNDIYSSIFHPAPLINDIHNCLVMNNNINIDYNINDINISNSQINNFGINNLKNMPLKNIKANVNNNNNNNNKKDINYSIDKEKFLYFSINNNINNDLGKKFQKNFSNNSIVSQNSLSNEQMSNCSTAEKFNINHKNPNKDIVENWKTLDDNALIEKIHDGLKKIHKYYKENPFHGDKKINCKFYILILNFFIIVSNMFLYYLSAIPLDN